MKISRREKARDPVKGMAKGSGKGGKAALERVL